MLAADGKGNLIVSVHVKRTYQLLPTGECRVADEQAPFLSGEPTELPGASPDDNVFPELDIIPHKMATDLIVMASAYARAGKHTKRMIAGIDCGEFQHRMLVQGNRRSYFRPDGQIGFTDAEPFEVMPLRYERAYGGCDPTTPAPPIANLLDAMLPHPGIYPRNPAGRGYAVTGNREHVEGLALPNLENPRDAAYARRGLICKARRRTGGASATALELRLVLTPTGTRDPVHLGGMPDAPDSRRRQPDGGSAARVDRRRAARALSKSGHRRYLRSALQRRRVARSGAAVSVWRRDDPPAGHDRRRESSSVFACLDARPRIAVRAAAGKVNEVQPVANRILISTDEMGIYVVWHGAWPCPKRMNDLNDVEVFVDSRRLAPSA